MFQLLLLFIVGYIFYQLFTALGRKDFAPHLKRTDKETPPVPVEDLASYQLSQKDMSTVKKIKALYPYFSIAEFMNGATKAYKAVITAFYDDELPNVRGYVSNSVWFKLHEKLESYKKQLADTGVNYRFLRIKETGIKSVSFDDPDATITLEIKAEHTFTRDAKQTIEVINHYWAYSKNLSTNDPVWLLTDISSPQKE